MAVLELRAVNLDHGPQIPNQALRGGFDHPRFARSRWSQEQEVTDRTSRAVHTSQVHLIDVDDLVDGFILPDEALA